MTKNINMSRLLMISLDRLRGYVATVPALLAARSASDMTQKAPGKWSRKEIVGHLIDSALNNLKRFTDAQFAELPYRVQPYDQDNLVLTNRYQDLPMEHLLTLWRSLNTQIIYVVEAMSSDTLSITIQLNSSTSEQSTLAWLIDDYVAHLEHHLKTIL